MMIVVCVIVSHYLIYLSFSTWISWIFFQPINCVSTLSCLIVFPPWIFVTLTRGLTDYSLFFFVFHPFLKAERIDSCSNQLIERKKSE